MFSLALMTRRWNCRILRPIIATVVLGSLFSAYLYYQWKTPSRALYERLRATEHSISYMSVQSDAARELRYVLFKQLQGAGFDNQAQEVLLYHHLALETSRIYVYQPLRWTPRAQDLPLSAFLAGVTNSPHAVTSEVFWEACGEEETQHITVGTGEEDLWERAKKAIEASNARCLVVDDHFLTWSFLESSALNNIWPNFAKYLKSDFAWSQHILDLTSQTLAENNLLHKPFLALHFRRGDFESHCKYLARTQQGFTTWATLPLVVPSVSAPFLDTSNATSIVEHCYPSLERIANAIGRQVQANQAIKDVHVLHDGAWDHPFVYVELHQLRSILRSASWSHQYGVPPIQELTHSGLPSINFHDKDFDVMVDIEIARRANVFLGNGYSSLSTQVIALRLGADGGSVDKISLF